MSHQMNGTRNKRKSLSSRLVTTKMKKKMTMTKGRSMKRKKKTNKRKMMQFYLPLTKQNRNFRSNNKKL